ncbi:MAG: YncE family protein [Acidobacteriaceae bacterium]|nr:YncE family protein [Acidobacteriaceae bacterium]
MRQTAFVLLGTCVLATTMAAQSGSAPCLLVLSKGDHTLAIVDPATLKAVARMPSGPDPHEVIASSDGKLAFISNYGGGTYNTITPVDLMAHQSLKPIDLGPLRGPHGLAFIGSKLWFTAEVAKAIGSYDPSTKQVDWILGTGQNRTHMVMVNPDLSRIVTTNVASATISIIDRVSVPGPNNSKRVDWNETVVPVGRGAEGFDISPDAREIWVANAQDGTISVVDSEKKAVVATIAANVNGANRLKFTPDGKLVLVSLIKSPDVVVLNARDRTEAKRIPVGHGAEGMLMDPDGARAFVSATPDDYVAVIDLKNLTVTGRIDAGKQPDGLAWVRAQ